jgi:hypothetical protein
VAAFLWIVLAVLVWNVVFDHVIVVAGRAYIHAAGLAMAGAAPYPHMEDWMRPAAVRGVWIASASAAGVLALFAAGLAGARAQQRARLR